MILWRKLSVSIGPYLKIGGIRRIWGKNLTGTGENRRV